MKNDMIRGLLGSLVTLLLAGVMVLALQGYKAVVPAETGNNISNITQADYDQALAKWKAQNIKVYEVSYTNPRIELRLRVDDNTGKLYMLEHKVGAETETVDGLKLALSGVAEKTFRAYTIDSIYKTIHDALVQNQLSVLSGGAAGAPTQTFELNAKFDDTRGYPLHLQVSSRDTLASKEITWRTAVQYIDVTNFTPIP